jgi:Trypsin
LNNFSLKGREAFLSFEEVKTQKSGKGHITTTFDFYLKPSQVESRPQISYWIFAMLLWSIFAVLALVSEIVSFRLSIINGYRVSTIDAPYQAIYYARGKFLCGGSILSRWYILTAGELVWLSVLCLKINSCHSSLRRHEQQECHHQSRLIDS